MDEVHKPITTQEFLAFTNCYSLPPIHWTLYGRVTDNIVKLSASKRASFAVFTVVYLRVLLFWAMTLCHGVIGSLRF
jgi:hypothetical protein